MCMYIIRVTDCASGVERYISKIKMKEKGKQAYNKFETTHKRDKISKTAQFKNLKDAEEALNIALNDQRYWSKRYSSDIIKVEALR